MKLIISLTLLLSATAFAGKEQREYMKTDIMPKIAQAQDAYKKACACALKIDVKADSFASNDDLINAKYIAENMIENVAGYCTDAESKKALCKMKTLEIVFGKEGPLFKFASGKGTAITNGQSYVSLKMITDVLDK
ncbi:MAG: hypothetical protein SGJ18_08555 [Pseudomonadota bacterium]|nr:hypothetical protein [Pseudomonadota bacterium]